MSRLHKPARFCGTCQHYCWTLGPNRKTTCNNLGCIDTTPGCTDYSINPFVLQDFEKVLSPLADVLRVMPLPTLSMFYEIVAQEKNLRRRGFCFMEKVAVKYFGSESDKYISNYVIGRVYSADNEGVFLIAKSGIRMYVLRSSIIKLEPFMAMKKEMKREGFIVDPTINGRASAKQKLAVVETLDDIIARGLVEDADLDSDIKRKLNPKRITREMMADSDNSHTDSESAKKSKRTMPTELSLSTKKKKGVEAETAVPEKGKNTLMDKLARRKKSMPTPTTHISTPLVKPPLKKRKGKAGELDD